MTKHFSFLTVLLTVIFVFFGISGIQINAHEGIPICARYVDGFGSNHGWHDVDKAEGWLGEYYEEINEDYAWKYLDSDFYGRLLKAYDFESWTQTGPIQEVFLYLLMNVYDPNSNNSPSNTLDVEVRIYNGTNVIATKIEPRSILNCVWADFYYVAVPTPTGGWTKDKVDNLQVWSGAKERKEAYLQIHSICFHVN